MFAALRLHDINLTTHFSFLLRYQVIPQREYFGNPVCFTSSLKLSSLEQYQAGVDYKAYTFHEAGIRVHYRARINGPGRTNAPNDDVNVSDILLVTRESLAISCFLDNIMNLDSIGVQTTTWWLCMPAFCAEVSALNHQWVLRPDRGVASVALVTSSGRIVPDEVSMIASRRGAEDVMDWIEPTIRKFMPDPLTLNNMQAAVNRIQAAFVAGERIAIMGDYDVDGATSTAILTRFMRMVGHHDTEFYIPQRMTEGYGPNIPAVEILHSRGATLLIIADSGTLAFKQIDRAVELGMGVIVLDHHEPQADGSLPNAIVVNPKVDHDILQDNGAPTYLCTAGLAFLFVIGVNRALRDGGFYAERAIEAPDLQPLLGLVALGTVADVVPLRRLNRAYVQRGLRHMPENPGIKALLEFVNKVTEQENVIAEAKWQADFPIRGRKKPFKPKKLALYNAYACGFLIGPCLNAAGRLDDCMQATTLLTCDDVEICEAMAAKLHGLNRDRQKLQETILNVAIAKVKEQGFKGRFILAYDESWHPGVIGLAASKLKDMFDLPAIVIGQGGKGSARSIKGFNLGQSFMEAVAKGLLIKGGGHAAAAGLTIDASQVEAFEDFLAGKTDDIEGHRVPTNVDMTADPGSLTVDLVESFELMEPFGMSNSRPRIAITGGVLVEARVLSNDCLAATIRGTDGGVTEVMAWRSTSTVLKEALLIHEGHYVDILGTAEINDFSGSKRVKMSLLDVMVGPMVERRAA